MFPIFVIGLLEAHLKGVLADITKTYGSGVGAIEGGVRDNNNRIVVRVIEGDGLPLVI